MCAPHMIKILRTLLDKMYVMPHKKFNICEQCKQLRTVATQYHTVPHSTTQCHTVHTIAAQYYTVAHIATQLHTIPHNCRTVYTIAAQLPYNCTIIGINFLLNTKYQTSPHEKCF